MKLTPKGVPGGRTRAAACFSCRRSGAKIFRYFCPSKCRVTSHASCLDEARGKNSPCPKCGKAAPFIEPFDWFVIVGAVGVLAFFILWFFWK